MFTGIIERTGKIARVSRGRGLSLEIRPDTPWPEPYTPGESIAVDGVCLTVSRAGATAFAADVLPETEKRSTLGGAVPGTAVNLEKAVKAGGRLGGHVVQGHVDGTGTVKAVIPRGRDFALEIACGPAVSAAIVEKGSIAVNGVSLTISANGQGWFRTEITPSTAAHTTLPRLRPGDRVNLETDVLGRYARGAALPTDENDGTRPAGGGLTFEMLAENGFI